MLKVQDIGDWTEAIPKKVMIFCPECGKKVLVEKYPGSISRAEVASGNFDDYSYPTGGGPTITETTIFEKFHGSCGHVIEPPEWWTITCDEIRDAEIEEKRIREIAQAEAQKRIPVLQKSIKRLREDIEIEKHGGNKRLLEQFEYDLESDKRQLAALRKKVAME